MAIWEMAKENDKDLSAEHSSPGQILRGNNIRPEESKNMFPSAGAMNMTVPVLAFSAR
jgi:hypothetical protein